MNARYLLVVFVVAMTAAALPVVLAWVRSGRGNAARPRADRLGELRWWIGLLVTAGYAMIAASGPFGRNALGPWLAIFPLAAGCLILLRPRWVRGVVAVAVLLVGLHAFAATRDHGLVIMLPLAYLLLGLGGWLSWRAGQYYPGLARPMERWRSRLRERGGSLWCLALFPVVFTTAALMTPDLWSPGRLSCSRRRRSW